jgi:hypothetical protein
VGGAVTGPSFVEKITSLFVREEQDQDPPFGRALAIGTGVRSGELNWPSVVGQSQA